MKLYAQLSSWPFLSKYSTKFLFIAFIGIHVPLLGLIFWLALLPSHQVNSLTMVLIALVLTLMATGTTLMVLNMLIAPIRESHHSLQQYLKGRQLPQLPTHFTDEAGLLMANLQNSITRLDLLLTTKEDLAYLLSHNMRSPSMSLLSLSYLIQKETGVEKRAEYCRMIEKITWEQLHMLDAFLYLLKSDELVNFTNQPTFSVEELCHEDFLHIEPLLKNKGLTLEREIQPELKVQVERNLFVQAVINLLANAIKFGAKGQRIVLKAWQEGEQVKFCVQDQGLGFDHTIAEELFQKFTPHGRKGTANEKTTGIGLYLCRQIIERHGGSLVAHSDGPGLGATFTITLPAAPVTEALVQLPQLN